MKKNQIRIFTYLPNPRIWKALIAADVLGVKIEIRSDKPNNLNNWLWDFNARLLSEADKSDKSNYSLAGQKGFKDTLIKTKRFLRVNPYGTIPVAFSMSGNTGVFESNSILRVVARLGKNKKYIYGKDSFSKSRIDSFLDSSLVFGALTQTYSLSLYSKKKLAKHTINATENAFTNYLNGIEKCLEDKSKKYLISNSLTIADICFFGEFSQFLYYETKAMRYLGRESKGIFDKYKMKYKLSKNFFCMLLNHSSFKKVAFNDLNESGVLKKISFKYHKE